MKSRLGHWPSTITGLGVLAFLAFAAWLEPSLLTNPGTLVFIAGGLYGLFHKSKGTSE